MENRGNMISLHFSSDMVPSDQFHITPEDSVVTGPYVDLTSIFNNKGLQEKSLAHPLVQITFAETVNHEGVQLIGSYDQIKRLATDMIALADTHQTIQSKADNWSDTNA